MGVPRHEVGLSCRTILIQSNGTKHILNSCQTRVILIFNYTAFFFCNRFLNAFCQSEKINQYSLPSLFHFIVILVSHLTYLIGPRFVYSFCITSCTALFPSVLPDFLHINALKYNTYSLTFLSFLSHMQI